MTAAPPVSAPRILALGATVLLGACSKGADPTDFNAVEFGEFSEWGQGIEGLGGGGSGGGGTDTAGGDGGGTNAYDGTWQGTYTVNMYMSDFGYSCTCSSGVTLGIIEGQLQVGQGESCSLDCSITTRLTFTGSVGGSGAAAGTVDESTSFFYSTAWTGAFTSDAGSGSWSDTVVVDTYGNVDVSGSFTVTPL